MQIYYFYFWEKVKLRPKGYNNMIELRRKLKIQPIETGGNDWGYHRALSSVWGKEDFIMIEHDVVPTEEQIQELIDCSHKDCTFAASISKPLPGTQEEKDRMSFYGTLNLWNLWDTIDGRGQQYRKNQQPEFAKGIMMCKISLETQKKIGNLKPVPYWEVYSLFPLMHVHYEVEHDHPYTANMGYI